MAGLVAQNAVAQFTTPVDGTTNAAAPVLANDNANALGHTTHDADGTIHLQSSVVGSRPAFGTLGRKWLSTDTLKVHYDTGAAWSEIAYLPLIGGTLTGSVLFSADNTYVIGAVGASRPSHVYVGTAVLTPLVTNGGSVIVDATSSGSFEIQTNSVAKWRIPSAGHFIAATDNTYDIGATSDNRPRDIFIRGNSYVMGATASGKVYIGGSPEALRIETVGADAIRLGTNGTTRWQVEAGGVFSPFVDNTYDVGSSSLRVRAVYAASIVSGTHSATAGLALIPGAAGSLDFYSANTIRAVLSTAGHWLFSVDNASDIGAVGASRPRNIYVAGAITGVSATLTGALVLPAGTTSIVPLTIAEGVAPTSPANGNIWTTAAGLFVRTGGVTQGPFGTGVMGGSGTANTIPLFTAGATLGNSILTQSAGSVVVAGAFVPEATGTRDLGNSGALFRTVYVSSNVTAIDFGGGGASIVHTAASKITFNQNSGGAIDFTGGTPVIKLAGTQVVAARRTGWTAATGTATRATFVTGSVTLSALAEAVKALIDDLTTHGLIGA